MYYLNTMKNQTSTRYFFEVPNIEKRYRQAHHHYAKFQHNQPRRNNLNLLKLKVRFL